MTDAEQSGTKIGFGALILFLIGLFLCATLLFISLGRDDATPTAIVATQPEPRQEIVSATPSAKAPTAQPEPIPQSTLRLDVVRVNTEGSAVVAGRAEPGHTVSILGNDKVLGTTVAGADGSFVALLDVPSSVDPTVLTLSSKETPEAAQTATVSQDSFLVMPTAKESKTAPMIVAVKKDRVTVTQGAVPAKPPKIAEISEIAPVERSTQTAATLPTIDATDEAPEISVPSETKKAAIEPTPELVRGEQRPSVVSSITLDTIDYSKDGDVVLSGRGTDAQDVRVYVDNQPVELGRVEDGRWSLSLPNVDEGIYTVRVDALDETGRVVSRVESPFKRETPDLDTLGDKVTIQPGFTLWQLAAQKYGAGGRYVQIFDANRDAIKDPDLIYPGQVFKLPDQ